MNRHLLFYKAPEADYMEGDCISVLCSSQGQGGSFDEYGWEQDNDLSYV